MIETLLFATVMCLAFAVIGFLMGDDDCGVGMPSVRFITPAGGFHNPENRRKPEGIVTIVYAPLNIPVNGVYYSI